MLASVVASVAQYERRLIGARTRDAMAAHKRQGAKYGRPSRIPKTVRSYVHRLRREGQTLDGIASRLNARNIPTGQGGQRWRKSSVAVVLRSVAA
jgi:DNA invertase Pin-like site-specific DNA recombinase